MGLLFRLGKLWWRAKGVLLVCGEWYLVRGSWDYSFVPFGADKLKSDSMHKKMFVNTYL